MKYSETRRLIDQRVDFPITQENVVEQLGTVEVTPPTGDSVPLSEILTRANESTYVSAEMLYTTIVGNLDEAFIGRKYYDDRSGSGVRSDTAAGWFGESVSAQMAGRSRFIGTHTVGTSRCQSD